MGIIILLIIIYILIRGLYEIKDFKIKIYSLKTHKVNRDYTIVFLSDVHNQIFGENNHKLIQAIDNIHPDFILIGGDMIIAKPNKNMDNAKKLFQCLDKKYRIYYANGNHEHRIRLYPEIYKNMNEELELCLDNLNIHRLINNRIIIEDLNIIGLEIKPYYYKRFQQQTMSSEYITEEVGEVEENYFNILLAHNPEYFQAYSEYGADLTLSGHVHGGIIRILGKGVISPKLRLFPQYDGGEFTKNGKKMIISRGLGVHTLSFRLFNNPEVVVIKITK